MVSFTRSITLLVHKSTWARSPIHRRLLPGYGFDTMAPRSFGRARRMAKGKKTRRRTPPRHGDAGHSVGSRPAVLRQESRSEKAVEHREMDREVLVDGLALGGVMEVMVAGRGQERLQPDQAAAEVGV